ncbi:MAG: acetyl-CoA carboxylase biotin carboxyl carrier protein [Coriobacteriales bacterium]|nr:acetyl-CoA carboxylase biotin carboxyl carrier protein [Coriobacteriales bacterium]
MRTLYIMDTTIRDAHQSLWATRMSIGEMLPILPKLDDVGYWAIEAWGGATFDTCLRFLDENPWERLRAIKKCCSNTPLSMLVRGQNLVGYRHYSQEIVDRFIKASHRNGIDVFRVFDALNDIRNVKDCAAAVKEAGAHLEGALSYTMSPVHTLDSFIDYSLKLKELGADSICIKDMAGMLTPYRTERLVKALCEQVDLPIHVHCHYVGGMAPANYLKAAEAGAAIVDTASAPLAFGNSQPAVEMVVAALKESGYDTGLDLDLLFEISEYWEEVRKRGNYSRGVSSLLHMQVYSHQVPGGMMSNLISQLEIQKASDRLADVMEEIPRVRAEVGYPPLVTPMSQIVGTQAVFNVLTGKRWSVISTEMKDYVAGYYGKSPGRLDKEIVKKVLGATEPLDENTPPSSLVTTTYDEVAAEAGELAQSEEDVLMWALFPNEARTYLSKHRTSEKTPFLLEEESVGTKEEQIVDMNQIRELIRVVEDSGIGEVTVEEAGSKITVRAPGQLPLEALAGVAGAAAAGGAASGAPTVDVAQAGAPVPAGRADAAADDQSRPAHWVAVVAPMVGTFYAAPAPDKPAYVKEGDKVSAGQALCIVEAMKLMNEINAEQMGTVREICVENAQPVEYGTVLFYIEPIIDEPIATTVV